jgi:uncharacterized protein (TIGR03083 family)
MAASSSISARAWAPRVRVLHLFSPERRALLDLLASLEHEAWHRATACPGWSVKDIVAHLLLDDVRRLSAGRDRFAPPLVTDTFAELVALVNEANERWVAAFRPLSPQVLQELLSVTGPQTLKYFGSLALDARGGPVTWASPDPAPVWLDIAREYTERWVHQQQIRDATDRRGLQERRFKAPVLATFVHALPHTYRQVAAAEGTEIELTVDGPAGGRWRIVRADDAWQLRRGRPVRARATIRIDEDVMWRLPTRGMDAEAARSRSQLTGDVSLTEPFFSTLAIIA